MYALEFRKAVLLMYDYFQSLRKVSKCMKVSIASISRWNNCLFPKLRTRTCIKTSNALKVFIETLVLQQPCITCVEICQQVYKVFGFTISRQLVHVIIKSLNFSFKRVKTRGISSKKESLVKQFIHDYKQISKNHKIVSIDESGFDQRAHRIYGYAPKGKEAIVNNSLSSDRKHYSLLLAISNEGDKDFIITNENINTNIFNDFINHLPFEKGTCLIMDNHRIHRTRLVHETFISKGYKVLYTPPYSPEFNPIELIFGNIKTKYYKSRFQELPFHIKSSIIEHTSSMSKNNIMNCFHHVEQHYIFVKSEELLNET
jgi:transposase